MREEGVSFFGDTGEEVGVAIAELEEEPNSEEDLCLFGWGEGMGVKVGEETLCLGLCGLCIGLVVLDGIVFGEVLKEELAVATKTEREEVHLSN